MVSKERQLWSGYKVKRNCISLKVSFKSMISNVNVGNWEKLESLKLNFVLLAERACTGECD